MNELVALSVVFGCWVSVHYSLVFIRRLKADNKRHQQVSNEPEFLSGEGSTDRAEGSFVYTPLADRNPNSPTQGEYVSGDFIDELRNRPIMPFIKPHIDNVIAGLDTTCLGDGTPVTITHVDRARADEMVAADLDSTKSAMPHEEIKESGAFHPFLKAAISMRVVNVKLRELMERK